MGWRYKYIQAGASDREETLTFYHLRKDSMGKNNEQGFSTVKTHGATPEDVPLIHLANWVKYHILERKLPNKVYGNYDWDDGSTGKVVMKMDIEGSEYVVLPSLIYSGVFCNAFDFVWGEDHGAFGSKYAREAIDPEKDKTQGQLSFASKDEADHYFKVLSEKALQSLNPDDCKARWQNVDDERYPFDKQPYPTP